MSKIDFKKINPLLKSNEVEFAGVFGSFARGEASRDSDIDLLVKFRNPKSLLEIIRLEREMSEVLDKKIDLVTEPSLNPHLRERVLGDLEVFYGEGL